MNKKVFIFDSHPIQYKVPIYQVMAKIIPHAFEVIFATDSSARGGYYDNDFCRNIVWDTPLLSGYPYRVLGNETKKMSRGREGLSGRGILQLLLKERPLAVILTGSGQAFDRSAYVSALLLGIPIMIRHETQDAAFSRGAAKSFLRDLAYRLLYFPVAHAFAIGVLSFQHLIRHGIKKNKISVAKYFAPNPIASMDHAERSSFRKSLRGQWGVRDHDVVISFFGKLIPKKNPDILFLAAECLPEEVCSGIHFLFVGSGEMKDQLIREAGQCEKKHGIKTTFAGFVNQTQLSPYYLASDIVVLPSRKMGETWGLVVNEALQAGCSVVMTDAVGCHPEFRDLDRVRIIPVENKSELARVLKELSLMPRDFFWAESYMKDYSAESAANVIAHEIQKLCNEKTAS